MQRIEQILRHPVFIHAITQINHLEQRRIYCKHGMQHLLDVARICYILCLEHHISVDKPQIYAAALLHDIGRAEELSGGRPHQLVSVELAEQILNDCGFIDEKENILFAIQEHRKKETVSVKNFAQALCEADHLSRMCFCCSAQNGCNWSEERRNHTIIL